MADAVVMAMGSGRFSTKWEYASRLFAPGLLHIRSRCLRKRLRWLTLNLRLLAFWSVAYLHRQHDLKAAGAMGALVSAAPIIALITGHVGLGAGAAFGISALLAAAEGAPLSDLFAIKNIDNILGIWDFVTARLLLSGRIRLPAEISNR